MRGSVGACLFVLLIALGTTRAQTTVSGSKSINGTAGNSTIFYQSSDGKYFNWGNVKNPIDVSIRINSTTGGIANVCLNSFERSSPISGAAMEIICPSGAYGVVHNISESTTSSDNVTQWYEDNEPIDRNITVIDARLYVKPTTGGAFIATLPNEGEIQQFELTWRAKWCEDDKQYPVSDHPTEPCIDIPSVPLDSSQSFSLNESKWDYYYFDVTMYTSGRNSISIDYTGSSYLALYVQQDYYPTASWYLPTHDVVLSDGTITASILTPGFFNAGVRYFFAFRNLNAASLNMQSYNLSSSGCTAVGTFGYNCGHTESDASSPLTGIYQISGVLSQQNGSASLSTNFGQAFSWDLSDHHNAGDYAYFSINEYPNFPTPFYIRVTVSNNDVTDENGAPALYATQGGYPSAQFNQYNASTLGDVTHQIEVRIEADDLTLTAEKKWYFAVALPADFSIWVATNCADNCQNGLYGVCMCGDQPCPQINTTDPDLEVFYQKPFSTDDSAGACICYDDDYSDSFDCTETNNQYLWLWISLIVLFAVLIFVIALGVPGACYFLNRKAKNDYEAM